MDSVSPVPGIVWPLLIERSVLVWQVSGLWVETAQEEGSNDGCDELSEGLFK